MPAIMARIMARQEDSQQTDNPEQPGHRALRKGRVSLPWQVYLVTTATHGRRPVFLDFFAGCAVGRCSEDPLLLGDARMLAWVLMPDHVHWLLQLGERDDLSTVINRLKSSSSRQANRVLGQNGAIWQKSFHDHALRAEEDIRKVARYIVANPLRAGLVEQINDYPFWNAIWL
jgi:putative transposase